MLPSAESIQIILPIVSIIFLVMTFFRPIYGVISYFIILNAKLGAMYPALGAIRFEFLAAVIVLISIFINGTGLRNLFPKQNELNKAFWVMSAISMLSVVQAVDVNVAWDNGGYPLLKLVLFYVMVVSAIRDDSDLYIMIWAFILVSVWIAYEPVTNYFSGIVVQKNYGAIAVGRYGAARGHVALANTLSQALPLSIIFALLTKKKFFRVFIYALSIFLIIGIILSKSRGGFLGLTFIAIGFVYISKKKVRTLLICFLIGIPIMIFAGTSYLDRVSTIAEGVDYGRSTQDRFLGLVNGIDMLIKRPIMGVGIGCYATARKQYFNYYFYAHNLYGELLGELGLCSFFWYYWIYHIFKYKQKIQSQLMSAVDNSVTYIALLTGIQFSLLLRLFIGNFTHGAFIWFWFLMAGLSVSIGNLLSQSCKSPVAPKLKTNGTI